MRVPTYPGPQEQAQPIPFGLRGPRLDSVASTETLGAGAAELERFGNAEASTGAGLSDIATQMQDRDNLNAVQTALTGIQSDYTDYRTQLEQKQGAQADGVTDQTKDWWDERAAKGAEALQNPAQQQAFAQHVAQLRNASVANVAQYETGQRRQATQDSTTASIGTSIDAAVANGDAASIAIAKQSVLAGTSALAKLNGWDAPTALAYGDEQLTKLHTGMIDKLLTAGNAGAAQAYYDANKQDINGLAQPKIEQALKIGNLKTTAQGFADQQVSAGADEATALAAARKQFDGDQEAAAVADIKTRFAEKQQQLEQGERNAADSAWQSYDKTQQLPPPNVLASMTGESRAQLTKYAQDQARGVNTQTDWPTYHDLRQQAVADPADFAKLDLNNYRTELAPGQMKEMIDIQTSVGKPGPLHDVQTLQEQLNTMHNTLDWGASDKDKMGAFDSVVTQEINSEQTAAKRPLTFDERQKVIDRMAIQGSPHWGGAVNPANWFGSTPQYYETQGPNRTTDAASFSPKIPDGERADIEAALTRAKLPVSDEVVNALYKRYHGIK